MKPTFSSSSSSSSSPSSCFLPLTKSRLSAYIFTLLAFAFILFFAAILYGEDFVCIFIFGKSDHNPLRQPISTINESTCPSCLNSHSYTNSTGKEKNRAKLAFALWETKEGCDVFSGRWVKDELTRPLYGESECPYIVPQLTCQDHGRPDRDYQHWRWQPHGCDLPSFNATLMLETLRGKRMMFVGDSLNRGQYVSMVCLLQGLIPEIDKSMETFDSLTVFAAKNYNTTIEFYWAPFLLKSNSDNAVIHRITDRIVGKGSIDKHGQHWKGADILVFNTYLWWMTGEKMKILKGSFDDEKKEIVEMPTEKAYRMAMKSMLRWLKLNMDPRKTRVFFTSMSPTHGKSIEWGGELGKNCYNETTPIEDRNYWGSDCEKRIMQVIGEVFRNSKFPITFLNITQLSSYRKDAHTSIYKKQWNPLSPEQVANPVSYADCTHWCLPGLQDTWNELLFATLFYPSKSNG